MSYEFKDYATLAGEDVTLVIVGGDEIEGEIVAVDDGGYYVRVSKEGGQEYYISKPMVVVIQARSRKVGGSND
jgi:phage gp45-like